MPADGTNGWRYTVVRFSGSGTICPQTRSGKNPNDPKQPPIAIEFPCTIEVVVDRVVPRIFVGMKGNLWRIDTGELDESKDLAWLVSDSKTYKRVGNGEFVSVKNQKTAWTLWVQAILRLIEKRAADGIPSLRARIDNLRTANEVELATPTAVSEVALNNLSSSIRFLSENKRQYFASNSIGGEISVAMSAFKLQNTIPSFAWEGIAFVNSAPYELRKGTLTIQDLSTTHLDFSRCDELFQALDTLESQIVLPSNNSSNKLSNALSPKANWWNMIIAEYPTVLLVLSFTVFCLTFVKCYVVKRSEIHVK